MLASLLSTIVWLLEESLAVRIISNNAPVSKSKWSQRCSQDASTVASRLISKLVQIVRIRTQTRSSDRARVRSYLRGVYRAKLMSMRRILVSPLPPARNNCLMWSATRQIIAQPRRMHRVVYPCKAGYRDPPSALLRAYKRILWSTIARRWFQARGRSPQHRHGSHLQEKSANKRLTSRMRCVTVHLAVVLLSRAASRPYQVVTTWM